MGAEQPGWPELQALLRDGVAPRAAIQESFPENRDWSYLAALELLYPEQAKKLEVAGRRLVSASLLSKCPILAVAGKLNAGKTSVVSSFLSPEGRERALRGEANHQGTHRFALWLPQLWREDPELFGTIRARIGDALGALPEELHLNPDEAHLQYNNRDGGTHQLNVPLIATDSGLDKFGFGFLDCPDTDTSETLHLGSPEERLELIRRAAPLCSGFLVVAAHHAIRDARLEHVIRTLAEAMPNLDRFLAVNMVRPRYAPHEVRHDLREFLARHGIRQLYLAYDYEIPESARYRPATGTPSSSTVEKFPEFFVPGDASDSNRSEQLTPERWLRTLPKRLNSGEMFQKLTTDLRHGLLQQVRVGMEWFEADAKKKVSNMDLLRKKLLDATLQYFVAKWSPDGKILELRVLHNQAITQQLIDAFTKSAPWYAKLPLQFQSWSKGWLSSLSSMMVWLKGRAMKETVDQVTNRLKAGRAGRLLSPESLCEVLQQMGVSSSQSLPDNAPDSLLMKCRQVVDRLEHEMTAKLDEQALMQAANEVWRNIPAGKKLRGGITGLGVALAAFGAVLMIPLDGGGTMVLAAASVKELLGAAGLSVGAAWWSGQQFQRAVAGATAVQQLSDCLSALCDTFGVPRSEHGLTPFELPLASGSQRLPLSSLSVRADATAPLSLYRLRDQFKRLVLKW